MTTASTLGQIFAVTAVLVLAGMIGSAQGAITAVNNGKIGGSAPGATVTQLISAGAGADMLIVGTASELGGTVTANMSVTYGGVPMNLATGNYAISGIWYLDLSTPGNRYPRRFAKR